MSKIASSKELQSELHRLLAYAQTVNPSRKRLASGMRVLAARVADRQSAALGWSGIANPIVDAVNDAGNRVYDAMKKVKGVSRVKVDWEMKSPDLVCVLWFEAKDLQDPKEAQELVTQALGISVRVKSMSAGSGQWEARFGFNIFPS